MLGRADRGGIAEQVVPVSYMNSSADIKAFTGRHGGTICTSSNAKRALEWAFEQGEKVLFLPDQHLGRNTAVRDMGMSLEDCVVYNPHKPNGGLTAEQLRDAKMILWRGPLLGARPLLAGLGATTCASGSPASTSWCTPSASTRSSPPPTTSARPSTSSRPWRRPRPARSGRSAPS